MARFWFFFSIVVGSLSVIGACILAAAGYKDWALIPVVVGLICVFGFFFSSKYIEFKDVP